MGDRGVSQRGLIGQEHHLADLFACEEYGGAMAGWDSHPLEKRRLTTAHTHNGHLASQLIPVPRGNFHSAPVRCGRYARRS